MGSEVKNPPISAEDVGSIPGSGTSPGAVNSNPIQYSCLGNCMDRGAWWAAVQGVAKSWTWPSNKQQQYPLSWITIPHLRATWVSAIQHFSDVGESKRVMYHMAWMPFLGTGTQPCEHSCSTMCGQRQKEGCFFTSGQVWLPKIFLPNRDGRKPQIYFQRLNFRVKRLDIFSTPFSRPRTWWGWNVPCPLALAAELGIQKWPKH